MKRRIAVHHFVANLTTRQYGPHPTSDLLGVDYIHEVPPDTEFPRWLPRMDVFTRFYLTRARPVEFMIQIRWVDAPDDGSDHHRLYGPYPVQFQRTDLVIDHAFRLINVFLEGAGRYEVLLLREITDGWQAGSWVKYAETHFLVER